MPGTETPTTPTQPARRTVSLAVVAAIAAAAATIGSVTAITIADYSATAGDHRLRSERSVKAQLVDACMWHRVGWACGVDRVEFVNDLHQIVVHVNTAPTPGSAWSHEPPAAGYNSASREVLRTSPLGTAEVLFADHTGAVIGHSGVYGPSL